MKGNVKKVYVVNLDSTRILILTGVLFSMVGTAFLFGLRFQDFTLANGSFALEPTHDISDRSADSKFENEQNLSNLPPEDRELFQNPHGEVIYTEDPFMEGPDHKTSSNISRTTPRVVTEKRSTTSGDGPRYYTIQLAAFKHERDALSYKKELKEKGLETRIDRGILYYFVRIGKEQKEEKLDPMLRKIRDTLKLEAIVVHQKIS